VKGIEAHLCSDVVGLTMIKQISLIALVVGIGLGALSLGTPVFATVQAGCTGNPHANTGATGDPHQSFQNGGNPHLSNLPGSCPGQK
jgi:hypothetical protein